MQAHSSEFYKQTAALIQKGDTDQAIINLKKYLSDNPEDPTAISLLGSASLRSGDSKAALKAFTRGVDVAPGSFAAHADLAFAAMQVGDQAVAVNHFKTALSLKPDFYQAWCFLSKLQFEDNDYQAAIEAVDMAETCDPMDADYQAIQAAIQADHPSEAEKIARDMLKRQAGHPRATFVLAHLAGTVGAHEESAKILKHGLNFHPANMMLRRALIQSLEAMGAYIPAVIEAKELTKINPDYQNWFILSRIEGHVANHEGALLAADKAAARLKRGDTELGKVDLLRGHALKILGRRKESEAAYRACIKHTPNNGAGWWGLADLKTYNFTNKDKGKMKALVLNDTINDAQRCQAAFALAKAYENKGDHGAAFSWYQCANDMRPEVSFSPVANQAFCDTLREVFDTEFLEEQAEPQPSGPTPIFIVGMPRAGSTLIEQILASHSQIEGTMELVTLPNLERSISVDLGQAFKQNYPLSLANSKADTLHKYGQAYVDATAMYRTDKAYFIDKLPPNFERIGLIHKIMPNAIIIDARRHPIDCGFSCFKQHFAAGHEFSYDLNNIGAYYNSYLQVMDHWNCVLPGKVLTVQYEDMVTDTEATVRALLAHIGVDFEESCLRFFENKRAVRTASSEQVRQPINKKGMGAWRPVAKQLTPLSQSLGVRTLARFDQYLE